MGTGSSPRVVETFCLYRKKEERQGGGQGDWGECLGRDLPTSSRWYETEEWQSEWQPKGENFETPTKRKDDCPNKSSRDVTFIHSQDLFYTRICRRTSVLSQPSPSSLQPDSSRITFDLRPSYSISTFGETEIPETTGVPNCPCLLFLIPGGFHTSDYPLEKRYSDVTQMVFILVRWGPWRRVKI